jgi:hypothetical protein
MKAIRIGKKCIDGVKSNTEKTIIRGLEVDFGLRQSKMLRGS